MKRNRLFALTSALVALTACQAYEVDPVLPAAAKIQDAPKPVGHKLTPNLMLVVDRSGSMADSADGSQSGQGLCAGQTGQHGVACKWQQLLGAMCGDGTANNPGFVSNLVTQGGTSDPIKIGLLTFAGSNACDVGVVQETISTSGPGNICRDLNAIAPGGGTPTAASMQAAAQEFVNDNVEQSGRSNYIVLLTDGAPNCNPNFQATLANCQDGTQYCVSNNACVQSSGTLDGSAPLGCLDEDNLVSTVQSINGNGIQTFVIGFGADFTNQSSLANDTLQKSAIAGGEAIYNNGQPATPAFYQATDQTSLNAALNAIVALVNNACSWNLDSTPPSPSAVEVVVTLPGGSPTTLSSNQYSVTGSTVTVTDHTLCDQLNASSASNPATIEFKYLGQ
ncbi:MAG: VWA domain-containing protein [Deltaproteobacteria bacterium]|nr:VWA domain-containing protein [Deltaproteobacteria bacterium]